MVRATLFAEHGHLELGQPGRAGHQLVAGDLLPGQAQNVGGARIAAVARTLGAAYRQPAAASFEHGYQLAVGAGAGCLLLAALIAVAGFRGQQAMPAAPPSREQQPERAR